MKFTKALVTGATSGIGEAVARLLAKQGIPLILTGRNREKLQELSEQLISKVPVETIVADLSLPNERAIVAAKIRTSVPDLLINNAGIGIYGDLLSQPKEKLLEVIQVDVEAVVDLTWEAAGALVQNKKQGVILNVASAAAFQPIPKFAVYSASKAFVLHFSESIDWELKPQGVRVLATCPGVVKTQFRERSEGKEKEGEEFMSPQFAAEQIWWQIQKEKAVHTFGWKYRFGTFMTKYLLPRSFVARVTSKEMEKVTQ